MVKVNMVLTSMGLVIMLTSAASLPLDGGEFESDRADRAEECGALADQFKAKGSLDDKATSNLIACCEEVFAGEAAPDPRAAVVCDAVRSAQCIGLAKQYEATKSLDDQSTATLSACCMEVWVGGTPDAQADAYGAAVCNSIRGDECAAVADLYTANKPMDAKATATLGACCNEVMEGGTAEAYADPAATKVCNSFRGDECAAVADQYKANLPMDAKAVATLSACCNEVMLWGTAEAYADKEAAAVCDSFRGAECGVVVNQYMAKMPMDAKASATLSACCNEVWVGGTAEAKADDAAAAVCDAVRKDECVAVANQFVAKKPMDDKATATLKACCNEISGRGDPEEIASAAVVCGAI